MKVTVDIKRALQKKLDELKIWTRIETINNDISWDIDKSDGVLKRFAESNQIILVWKFYAYK